MARRLSGVLIREQDVLTGRNGRLLPGAGEFLDTTYYYAKRGGMGLLSIGGDPAKSDLLSSRNLMGLFSASLRCENDSTKPCIFSDAYIRLAAQLTLDVAGIVVVEADPVGALAAKDAGFFVIGLTTTREKAVAMRKAGVNVQVLEHHRAADHIRSLVLPR